MITELEHQPLAAKKKKKRVVFDRETVLFSAARRGDITDLPFPLTAADLVARTPEGKTVLHIAAELNKLGMVRLLLRRGAPTDVVDRDGWNPLQSSAMKGSKEAAKLLM